MDDCIVGIGFQKKRRPVEFDGGVIVLGCKNREGVESFHGFRGFGKNGMEKADHGGVLPSVE